MLTALITIEVHGEPADPQRTEAMQLRDICTEVLRRLGFGPGLRASPRLHGVTITCSEVISSPRHKTPIEVVAAQSAEDETRPIAMDPKDLKR